MLRSVVNHVDKRKAGISLQGIDVSETNYDDKLSCETELQNALSKSV
jgi:hypothetical protein